MLIGQSDRYKDFASGEWVRLVSVEIDDPAFDRKQHKTNPALHT